MNILTIIVALLIFSIIVFIHELGHFSAAKLFGIRVTQFAVGMGPALWKKQKGDTTYSLRAIPLGGFCQMDDNTQDKASLKSAAWWKQAIVILAGAFLNIVLGFLVFIILQGSASQINQPVIADFVPNTNLAHTGFQKGDRIVRLNNTDIHIYEDLTFELQRITDQPVVVTAKRGSETITETVLPVKSETRYSYFADRIEVETIVDGKSNGTEVYAAPATDEYQEYIGQTGTESSYMLGFVAQSEKPTFANVIQSAFYLTIYNIKLVYVSLYELIMGNVPTSDISGPIGIIGVIGQAAQINWRVLFNIIGLLTVNLGIMNLLPIPALDGCRFLFVLVEAVTRRRIPPEKEGVIHLIGFALLIVVFLFTIYNDISKLLSGWFAG